MKIIEIVQNNLPIPPTGMLYHATYGKNFSSIKSSGLKPGSAEIQNFKVNTAIGYVFLTLSKFEGALMIMGDQPGINAETYKSMFELSKGKGVIFTIDPNKLDKELWSIDPYVDQTYKYKGHVPANAIVKTEYFSLAPPGESSEMYMKQIQ